MRFLITCCSRRLSAVRILPATLSAERFFRLNYFIFKELYDRRAIHSGYRRIN